MPKQLEPCIFCDELPCVCNGPTSKPKRERKKREPTVRPVADSGVDRDDSPGLADPVRPAPVRTRKKRVAAEVAALRVLNFHGLLHPEEIKKHQAKLNIKVTGNLSKEV